MMQRDERLVLDGWFRYYGYLFGFENLTVFDNGSIDPDVIDTLRRYERAGSTIYWEHTRLEDFHAKGFHFRNVVRHWDACGGYDFALPVDCDEFLAVFTTRGLGCTRTAIHSYLDSFIGEPKALGFGHCLYNVPRHQGCFWLDAYPKCFLAANTVEFIDHGFHAITSAREHGTQSTSLTYLHFHNKPFDVLKEQARTKLAGFIDPDDHEKLRVFKGPGQHLARYFFMTEPDYLHQFDDKLLIRFPAFTNQMRALGVESELFGTRTTVERLGHVDSVSLLLPQAGAAGEAGAAASHGLPGLEFDGHAYLRANPDVAAAGWRPLEHFGRHGFAERRRRG